MPEIPASADAIRKAMAPVVDGRMPTSRAPTRLTAVARSALPIRVRSNTTNSSRLALFSLLLFVVFERTLIGKALRATAVNRVGARLVGILPSTTGAIAFLMASALAGISGILIGSVATLYYD